jgi:hypothetical protein
MAHSIFSQASIPVAIIPVNIANLKNIYSGTFISVSCQNNIQLISDGS